MTLELTEKGRQLAILRSQLKVAQKTLAEQVEDAAADKKVSTTNPAGATCLISIPWHPHPPTQPLPNRRPP